MARRLAWSEWVSTRVMIGFLSGSICSMLLMRKRRFDEGRTGALAHDAYGPAPGKGDEHVVGALAVEIDPDGVFAGVDLGDHGGHVVENGDGVQPLGQDAEPLPGHGVLLQEGIRAVLEPASGANTLFRGEVTAPRVLPQEPSHDVIRSRPGLAFPDSAPGPGALWRGFFRSWTTP